MMASSVSRRSREVRNRTSAPSALIRPPTPGAWTKALNGPDQAALLVDQLAAAGADDAVPHLAAVLVEIVIAQKRKSGHAGTVFLGARSGA